MAEFRRKFYDWLMRWNGATISLDEALQNPRVPYGYKFIDGNIGVSGKKVTLPHYMAMFI